MANNFNKKISKTRINLDKIINELNTIDSSLFKVENLVKELTQNKELTQKTTPNEDLDFLISVITMDASDFIGLSIDEIKKLPENKRKCIEKMSFTKYISKNGSTKETVTIKLFSKIAAMNTLNKIYGKYN